jgi:signal recognition particle subunit SRP54
MGGMPGMGAPGYRGGGSKKPKKDKKKKGFGQL